MLEKGGSGYWFINEVRARECEYLVCTRNARRKRTGRLPEPHYAAFLVGRIAELVLSPDYQERWFVRIDRYAPVNLPGVWKRWRNPVRYTTLEELGIDPAGLAFRNLPSAEDEGGGEVGLSGPGGVRRLSIAEAKRGLAASFGVPVEAIEITIRG